MKTVLCSGGMDPLHIGHLNLLQAAASHGHVVVALNSDDWLRRKKGYCLMSYADRARILMALEVVAEVMPVWDEDETVCDALRRLRPDIYANGGDRTIPNPFEHAVCREMGITELFDVGGGKVRSSSELVGAVR